VHWSANFDEIQDFEQDIRNGFGGFGFMADSDYFSGTRNSPLGDPKAGKSRELDALAAYVSSLLAVHPSPYRNPDGSMTQDALTGQALFHSVELGCAACHLGENFTDSSLRTFMLHDVGTIKESSGQRLGERLNGIDTPTLKGIWETAPYLHDGSAATLMDVITTHNFDDLHGRTSHLTQQEKEQLVAYLLQLDDGHFKDDDSDRVQDSTDNCVDFFNPDQADKDGDGAGDPCDAFPDRRVCGAVPVAGFGSFWIAAYLMLIAGYALRKGSLPCK